MINLLVISIIAALQGSLQINDLSYLLHHRHGQNYHLLKYILAIPWIIKPLWGYLSDMKPIMNQRRKPYLFINSGLGFIIFTLLSLFDFNIKTVLILLIIAQINIVFCNVVAEAILVECSQIHTQRNISIFFGMRAIGGLLMTFALDTMPIHRNSFQILSIFPLLIFSMTFNLKEINHNYLLLDSAKKQLKGFLFDPTIYRPILFIFFFMATPSPSTSMFYFYLNGLKLNDDFFVSLKYTYSICSIVAIMIYYSFRETKFSTIIAISTYLYIFASLLSLIMITRINIQYNIPDYQFCMWDNILMQTLQEIATMPVLVLACKMCPYNLEGTVYSIIMSTINLGNVISREIGILLTYYLGITSQDFGNLWLLVLVCNILSQIPIPFIGAINEEQLKNKKKSWLKDDLHKIL